MRYDTRTETSGLTSGAAARSVSHTGGLARATECPRGLMTTTSRRNLYKLLTELGHPRIDKEFRARAATEPQPSELHEKAKDPRGKVRPEDEFRPSSVITRAFECDHPSRGRSTDRRCLVDQLVRGNTRAIPRRSSTDDTSTSRGRRAPSPTSETGNGLCQLVHLRPHDSSLHPRLYRQIG